MNSLIVEGQDRSIQMVYDLAGQVAKVSLVAYNVISWSQDFNAALEAAKVTVIGLAVIGLASQAVKAMGKASTENYLEKERAKLKILRENEDANRDSLISQNAELTRKVDEVNRRLHKQAGEFQAERSLHKAESDRLLKQLEIFSVQLNEALEILKDEREEKHQLLDQNQELLTTIKSLRKEIEGGQIENRSLIVQLNEVQDRKIENVQKQIDDNAAKINSNKDS